MDVLNRGGKWGFSVMRGNIKGLVGRRNRMDGDMIEVLESLHVRLEKLEGRVGLEGKMITTPNLEEKLSWSTIWHYAKVWKRKFRTTPPTDTEGYELLKEEAGIFLRWVLANRGPYQNTLAWARRESAPHPNPPPERHANIIGLIYALRDDGLSNGE